MKPTRFEDAFPSVSRNASVEPARTILIGTHASCSSFADLFDGGVIESDEEKQDLLRAMLLFASAGLDACVKQLVADALPDVIRSSAGARDQFQRFVERRLGRDDHRTLLASALAGDSARDALIDVLVRDLRSGSLQSAEELSRTAAYFDIPTADVIPEWEATTRAFHARNQISHELDTHPEGGGSRRKRARDDMHAYTKTLLVTTNRFLTQVDLRLG